MEGYFISMGISVVLQLLKDPAHKAQYRSAMLKIRNAINVAFAGDVEFQ